MYILKDGSFHRMTKASQIYKPYVRIQCIEISILPLWVRHPWRYGYRAFDRQKKATRSDELHATESGSREV